MPNSKFRPLLDRYYIGVEIIHGIAVQSNKLNEKYLQISAKLKEIIKEKMHTITPDQIIPAGPPELSP